MSSSSETPKKSVKGRPAKESSVDDFCCVCKCNFRNYYGGFNRRVSTENLFEIPERTGVAKCRLAESIGELGFTCRKILDCSSLVCAKCATKIRNATDLMRFLGSAFNVAVQNPSSSIEYLPIEVERFKRMSISLHSSNLAKVNKISSPAAVTEKMTVQTNKKSKARRSITYADGVSSQEARNEICNLMSVEDREGEKAKMKVIIPTGDETFTFRSPPDVMTANMIRNICDRNWKPVVNAMFGNEKLREELLSSLSRNMAREMTEYIRSDSMLKYSSPDELAAFSNRKLVHEIKVFCPLWHACITGAANVHQPDSNLDGSINSIALATSAIARR